MNSQIYVASHHGKIDETDRDRAIAAAERALAAFEWRKGEPQEIDVAEAYAAYRRHMSDEEYNRSPRETMLIAAWEKADSDANIELTKGWHDPNGASVEMAVA